MASKHRIVGELPDRNSLPNRGQIVASTTCDQVANLVDCDQVVFSQKEEGVVFLQKVEGVVFLQKEDDVVIPNCSFYWRAPGLALGNCISSCQHTCISHKSPAGDYNRITQYRHAARGGTTSFR